MITSMWMALSEPARAEDVAGHVSQAKFFLKKGWYDDALKELDGAAALPDGAIDPEVWYLIATVRYALLDVAGASDAAERAQTYARDDDQLYQAASYAQFLREQFGELEVVPPYPGFAGKLDLEPTFPPLDPELRAYLGRLDAKTSKKRTFPVVVSLPIGDYQLNGEPVTVLAGQRVSVTRTASQLAGSGFANAQLAKFELGVGLANWLGPQVSSLQPSVSLHGAVTQPVGGLVAGLFVDWTPTWYDSVEGQMRFSSEGWSLGGRIGYELANSGALVIRPSIGWRMAQIPGVERSCLASGDSFTCAQDGPAELVVYGTGLAQVALAELSIDYIDRSRKRTLGIGVKVIGEEAFGRLPGHGIARLPDGQGVDFVLADNARSFTATGFRFMPNVSIAF